MFYYYGRKQKLAKRYPHARYDRIIEPFAGSAAYSSRDDHRHKDVLLIERDEAVIGAWEWLLAHDDDELANIPLIHKGEVVHEPIQIMAMATKRWFTYRKNTVTAIQEKNWRQAVNRWPQEVPDIRHWTIIHGDYRDAPDVEATWFIDPPYQGDAGTGYRHGSANIDYDELAAWCLSRRGQVIVCEGADADWLPFTDLATQKGVGSKRNVERVWTNDDQTLLDLIGSTDDSR